MKEFISLIPDTITMCKSDQITITTRKFGENYLWNNGNTVNFINVTEKDTGWHICTISTIDTVWTDSVYLKVLPLIGRIHYAIDTAFCEGKSIDLSSTNTSAINYLWNTADSTREITINTSGIFWVSTNDGIHCTYIDSFIVNIQVPVPLNLPENQTLCEDVELSAKSLFYNHFLWNTGETTPSIKVNKSGIYIVQADNGICFVSDTTNIDILPKPILHLPQDTVVCFDELRFIILDAGEWKTYEWYPTGQHTRFIDVTFPEYYRVVVTDNNNCEGSDTALVDAQCFYSIFIPNALTTNGDSLNDIFMVRGRNVMEFSIRIYNRAGGEVFRSTNMNEGWNGTFKGELCPLGVYFYEINYRLKNSATRRKMGTITLLQ
jgi:gliding motility-associated-like protein